MWQKKYSELKKHNYISSTPLTMWQNPSQGLGFFGSTSDIFNSMMFILGP